MFRAPNDPQHEITDGDVWRRPRSEADQVADAYRQQLGREASADEVNGWLSGQYGHGSAGNLNPILAAIRGSGEAQQFRSRPQTGVLNGPLTGPPVSGPAPTYNPTPYTGYTPKYAMEGFDFAREQNPGKSAKDAFAYLANQAPAPPIHDKAALGQWFSQYIQPGMNALGHKVSSVDGDKFTYSNHEGEFTVDFGRGAGAQNGALAWQAEYANGGPSNSGYKATQQAILQNKPSLSGAPSGVPAAYSGGQAPQSDLSAYYSYLQQLMGQPQI